MATRQTKPSQIEASAGNMFADFGLPDAEKLKIKSGLVVEITRAVRRLELTQEEAGAWAFRKRRCRA
jgi:predicted XRE-type DNA-binding protein